MTGQLSFFGVSHPPEQQRLRALPGGYADEPKKPKTFELFEFQKACIKEIYDHIRSNQKRILLVAQMGSGKTLISSTVLRDATVKAKNPMRCLFLVDLNCLLDQTRETMEALGVHCTILQGTRKVDWSAMVVIASMQTLQSRMKKQSVVEIFGGSIGVICVDEAHDTAYRSCYAEIQDTYLPTGTVFFGMTATPWRLSQKQYLGQWFDVKVEAPQPPELIKMGRSVPCRAFGIASVFDLSHLDLRNGDFREDQMEEQATRKAALEAVVKEWKRIGENRPTAAFCSSVNHAKQLAQAFVEGGVSAEWQDGTSSIEDRKARNHRLRTGETKILCSVNTVTKGYDEPCIGCILFVRATMSKALFFQGAGRAGRVFPGKSDFLLLDFGGNVKRHGNPTGYQDYSIDPKPPRKRKKDDEGERSMHKDCPECSFTNTVFARVCGQCGYEFSPEQDEDEGDYDIELVEIFDNLTKKRIAYLRDQKRKCYEEGLSPDIPVDMFRAKWGFIPPKEWHQHAILGKRPSQKRKQEFLDYLNRLKKNEVWAKWHQRLEFGFQGINTGADFNEKESWWQVLGVRENCTRQEAKSAYISLAKNFHPDVCGEDMAKKNMQIINAAWERALQFFNRAQKPNDWLKF